MTSQLKKCNGFICKGLDKPRENFHKDCTSKDGLQSYCIDCKKQIAKTWGSTFDGFLTLLYKDLKHNCKKRPKEIICNITINDIRELYIKQDGKCALTKRELTYTKIDRNNDNHIINRWNISVDRIDPSKHYEKDNIQLVGSIVNRMKMDLSQADFIEICKLFL